METNNDYQNRLPEHPAPLELSGHVESPTAASGAAGGERISRAVGGGRRHGGGYVGWAWLTALAAAVLVCSIYWFSGHAQKENDNVNMAGTSVKNTDADAVMVADYTVAQPSAATVKTAVPAATAKPQAVAEADAPQDVVYLFPLNGAKITNDAVLNELAKKVARTGAYVSVVAYTDESGRAEYNRRLSERRAKEVGDYLIAHGVAADHVKTQGLGPTHAYPTAAQDRRAEVHVTYVN